VYRLQEYDDTSAARIMGGTARHGSDGNGMMARKQTDRGNAATGARQQILDAAEELFAVKGFDGTPTARIATAAGVPKGLLFYYFPTKDSILAALLAERLEQVLLDPETVAVPGDPVRSLLNIAATVRAAGAESEVLRTIVWHEQHVRPEARAALEKHRHALRDAIGTVLAASLPSTAARAAIHAAAAAWESVINARPLEDAAAKAADGLAAIAAVLCAGLTPAGATAA
jgi:AcrR family transcriptional regulator